ncbi:MAG: transporter [Planctomycetes bacterium]|nr:transporter [Planctomycetota bacterium]
MCNQSGLRRRLPALLARVLFGRALPARSISVGLLGALTACASVGVPRQGTPAPSPISPNRPTFSDGTSLVPTGHVQLETGWTLTRRSAGGVTTERHSAPEVVVRARVSDTIEARLLWGGMQWSEADGPGGGGHGDGGADVAAGIVVPLCDQGEVLPALAIEGLSTFGIGSDAFSSGHADPTAKLLWSYGGGRLPDWLAVGGNLIASSPTEAGDRFTQTAASVWATVTGPGPDTSWFAEWYVVSEPANNVASTQSVDFGIVQRVDPRIAIDARAGFGLDDRADDWFTGVGLSFLF